MKVLHSLKTGLVFIAMLCLVVSGTLFAAGQMEAKETGPAVPAEKAAETFIAGDLLPDAPVLAKRGNFKVGVKTVQMLNPHQLDILKASTDSVPFYDRPLTVEIWYPALVPAGIPERTTYSDVLGVSNNPQRPLIPFTYSGRALRDAEPDRSGKSYPLVILSHGFPGSRLMMSYLTENLASKGYVVASIGHTDSTFQDAGPFSSTLLNRSLDILFVLKEIASLGSSQGKSFLSGLVDADNTALIGYSMGGYGALNAAGAGYSSQAVKMYANMMKGDTSLEKRRTGNAEFMASQEKRIKAVVAFAPWGMGTGVWDAEGLAGLKIPSMFIVGSQDDVALYEKGVKALFNGVINSDSSMLTYINARHNVAPNPVPEAALPPELFREYYRYAEPAWNEKRINNINQHFLTAFLGIHLKGMEYEKYFDLIENANDGVHALDKDGTPKENHTYWEGFQARTAVGLEFRRNK